VPLVSSTRLRLRSWRYLPEFLIQPFRAEHQAKRATGSLTVWVLRDADLTFWTRTVWRDEATMRAFMASGVHRRMIARLSEWCDEAAVVQLVHNNSPAELRNDVMALAKLGKVFKLPAVLNTSLGQGPNGPFIPEVLNLFPDVPVINRPGVISAWDDPESVAAIEKTGRKKPDHGGRHS
jgi:heme-degrading monooxygenase HmoA